METVAIPEELSRWITAHMPGAPDLRRVRVFRGPAIPFDWLPSNRKKFIGITLWNRIWMREPFDLDCEERFELLFHELVHVRQFAKNPVGFPLRYLMGLVLKGYWNHPAEVEARAVAAELRGKYFGR
jgi:hypothetical protein